MEKKDRSSHRKWSMKIGVLRNFAKSQRNACTRVSFLKKLPVPACNFVKKENLPQVFFCEFCEITLYESLQISLESMANNPYSVLEISEHICNINN